METIQGQELKINKVLLIERFIEQRALPEVFVGEEETVKECAKHILQKETYLENIYMQ